MITKPKQANHPLLAAVKMAGSPIQLNCRDIMTQDGKSQARAKTRFYIMGG